MKMRRSFLMSHYILIALFLAGFNGEATAGKDKAAKEKNQGRMSGDEAGRSRSRAPSLTLSEKEEVDKMVEKILAKEEEEKKVARLVQQKLSAENYLGKRRLSMGEISETKEKQKDTMSDRDQEDLREKRQKIDKVMKETEYVFHQKWSIQKNYAILMERDSNSYKYKNKDIFNQEFRKIYTMFLSHFEENPMDVLRSMCAIETIWQTEEPRGETHVDPVEFKRIIDLIKTTFVREGFNKTFRDQTNLFDLLSVPKWQDYISRKLYEFNQKISLYTKHLADFEKNPTLEDSSMKIRYRENKYERSLCIFAQLSKKKRLEEALSILDQSPELKEEYKEKIDSIKETKDLFDKLSEIALRNRATY